MKHRRSIIPAVCIGILSGLIASIQHVPPGVHAQQPASQVSIFAPAPQGISFGSASASGQGGGATLYYTVVSRYPSGLAYPQNGAIVARDTPGESNLSIANPVVVSWSSQSGATGYDLLRQTTQTAPTAPCNTCTVSLNIQSTSFTDTGGNVGAYPPAGFSAVQNVTGTFSIDNILRAVPYLVWSLSTGQQYASAMISGPTSAGQIAVFNPDGSLSGMNGAAGPSGAMGPTGATGPTGSTGTNGTNGAVGNTGNTGSTGATGSTGSISAPTPPYVVVSGSSYGPILQLTPPAATGWTFVNQGSSTVSTVNTSLLFTFTAALGTDSLRGYMRNLPASTGYTADIGMLTVSQAVGMAISDGTKYIAVWQNGQGEILAFEFASATSVGSQYFDYKKGGASAPLVYLRFQDSGGSRNIYVCADVDTCTQIDNHPSGTFLTETQFGPIYETNQTFQGLVKLVHVASSTP